MSQLRPQKPVIEPKGTRLVEGTTEPPKNNTTTEPAATLLVPRGLFPDVAAPDVLTSDRYSPKASIASLSLPTVRGTERTGEDDLRQAKGRLQAISLGEAIRSAMETQLIIKTLSDRVEIETVTGFDPAIAAQQIGVSVSRFDPTITGEVTGTRIDQPPGAFFGPGLNSNSRRDEANVNYRLGKEWATGTTASIGYEPSLAYLFFPNGVPQGVNPAYSSDLVTQIRQPLLRGGSKVANLATVRIAEHRVAQAYRDIETKFQSQLRGVEEAYWQLHAAHVRLRAIEEAIGLARRGQEIAKHRYDAERVIYADVARAAVKLEEFLQQRLDAENAVRQWSYRLGQLIGLPPADHVFAPSDAPEREPLSITLEELTTVALQHRPDLHRRQIEIDIRRQELIAARNQLMPQLDARALHRTSGLRDQLNDSLRDMWSFGFNDWSYGIALTAPLGNRSARANLHAIELSLARDAALLRSLQDQVGYELAESLQDARLQHSQYLSALRQVEQTLKWRDLAKLRYEEPPLPPADLNQIVQRSGQETFLVALFDYQSAIEAHVNALSLVAQALTEYNIALARLEERRGTLAARWSIHIESSNTQADQPLHR